MRVISDIPELQNPLDMRWIGLHTQGIPVAPGSASRGLGQRAEAGMGAAVLSSTSGEL